MSAASPLQLNRELPAEFALAVACCRRTYAEEAADEARALTGVIDWDKFLAICRRHRVQGLAWRGLKAFALKVPAAVQAALADDAKAIAEQGLRAARDSGRIASAFVAAKVPLLFLKGLTLAKLAYGNPFLKMSADIDILVGPGDIASAASLLRELGYRLEIPRDPADLKRWHSSRKESVWRGDDGPIVELHSRVADQPQLLATITAFSASQNIDVGGGIELPTLADEQLFAYLCVHGASSAWFRLKWIADLSAFLHGRSAGDIDELYGRSQQLGAGRAAAQALLLAGSLFRVPFSRKLSERLNNRVDIWLARSALGEMLRGEPTERLLGTGTIHLTQFFLLAGPRYKLSELKRQALAAAGIF